MSEPRHPGAVILSGSHPGPDARPGTRSSGERRPRFYRRGTAWVAARSRATRIALVVVLGYLMAALLGTYVVPYSPTAFDVKAILQWPSWQHPFGTDQFGRDIFSRVVAGTRTIVVLSVTATLLSVGTGTLVGMASGYRGGLTDEVVMRAMDVLMALPGLLLALLILTMLGPSPVNLVVAIAIVFVPKSARVARSGVLALRNLGFVEAARLRGESPLGILLGEVLPNVREVVVVESCLRFAYSLHLISSLGFLGLGVQPPTPDWGLMIGEGRNFLTAAPWVVLAPALAIGVLVIAVNTLADGLWDQRRRSAMYRLL